MKPTGKPDAAVSARPGVEAVRAAAKTGEPGKYVVDDTAAAADFFLDAMRDFVKGTITTGCDPADVAVILRRLADDADAEARRRAALKPPTSRGMGATRGGPDWGKLMPRRPDGGLS